jgi:hypothetical protein
MVNRGDESYVSSRFWLLITFLFIWKQFSFSLRISAQTVKNVNTFGKVQGSAWKPEGWRGEGRGGRQGGEMAQTMYAHMNKWIK